MDDYWLNWIKTLVIVSANVGMVLYNLFFCVIPDRKRRKKEMEDLKQWENDFRDEMRRSREKNET